MEEFRIVKKYPNRRLYDTRISSYITLEDVRQLILDHEPVKVIDAKSGNDITRSVLLQIIAEHEEHGEPLFSTRFLTQMIRFYGDTLQSFMGSYLEKSMQSFLDQQQQFRNQLDNMMGDTPWSVMNDMAKRNMEMWRAYQDNFTGTDKSSADKPSAERAAKTSETSRS